MKINCIIVEDEPLALERTRSYVSKIPFLELLSTFNNATDALIYLALHNVDLIFLDINMGGLSGIELLERNKIKSEVIFTTAYHEYALKGYELNVADYLLKPFTLERFIQAVSKVQDKIIKPPANEKKFIFIKTEYRLEKIILNEIIFIEGKRDYRQINTSNKKIMTLQTFKDLEKEIPAHLICRVHKSYMVAIDKIERIEKDVIKIGDLFIPVSETYRKAFFKIVNK